MSYLESCSTNKLLLADEVYTSRKVKIDPKFITLQVSVLTNSSGVLKVYHSHDGAHYDTYGDEINISSSVHRQFSIKGVYLYVEYTNGETNLTQFNLVSKLSDQPREEASYISGITYQNSLCFARKPNNSVSELKVDASGNLLVAGISGGGVTSDVNVTNTNLDVTEVNSQDILTSLQSFTDNISFNTENSLWVAVNDVLNPVQVENVTDTKLNVDISGQTVDISGQRVVTDISGQRVVTDISGQRVVTDISGQRVITDISGQRVVTDISGQRVVTDISGQTVDISGQRVVTDISGQRVVTDISGQRVITDISGQRVVTDISGQTVNISNQITGYATETTQQDILNTVSNPPAATLILDSPEGISAYADSIPVPTVDTYKRKGWYYTNTSAGNKYNYYFYSNGNYTQTLADITGAWCVCENDSTTTTSSTVIPIFALYTVGNLNLWYQSKKVYTANAKMVSGMKYLFYWGVEPSVYPELPRIQLSLASQNGTLQPTEQILTMSVGSESSASVGTIKNLMTHIAWRNSSNEFITELISDSDYISTDVRVLDKLSSGLAISGSVSVSNFPAVQVVDVSGLVDVSGSVNVNNFPSVQVVDVSGLVDISGSVNVLNQISGFATETTLAQIDMTLSSGSLATMSTVENKANNNLRTDLYADNGTAQEKLTSVSGKLEVHNMDGKVSEITSALTTTNTYLDRNKYDVSGNLKTNIENSSLDCRIYGSSNGSTWHHIKTNANGVIHTHLETVASGALTATVSSGVYNALDVSIKNSSLPVNSVNSGSWGNAVNNGSINGFQYTSSFNISSSAYIYVIYRDGSTGVFDSIQVEFSFDDTNWYYLGDSIFPSTPQGQQYRQGTLNDKRKYGWNYMRFKNNGNSSLSSVYITVLGSSI